mgnify:CR=1 FL=1
MQAPDPLDEAAPFLQALEALGIAYMVTGGFAAMLYGEPRFTRDLDVVLALRARDAARLHDTFDVTRFYVPPVEVIREEAARARHGHFNLVDNETGFRADVYLAGEDPLEAWALAHRRRVDVGARTISVSPPEYLIAHKLTYRRDGGSDRHVRDVRAMLAVSDALIDRALLGELVDRLGVRAQWDEVVGAR